MDLKSNNEIIILKILNTNKMMYINKYIFVKHFEYYNHLIEKKHHEIEISLNIINDNYYISIEMFTTVIKYIHGEKYNIIKYNLNELFKLHAFSNKYRIEKLRKLTEKRLDIVIEKMPILYFNGSINILNLDLELFTIKFNNDPKINYNEKTMNTYKSKYKKLSELHKNIKNVVYCKANIEKNSSLIKCKLESRNHWNLFEILYEYDNYWLDDEIYNYALSYYSKKK